MDKPHRATGNPRGRPPKLPFDFDDRILEALRKRVDPQTGLVRPLWRQLARELHVGRTTIARHIIALRSCGAIESVDTHPSPKCTVVYYRLKG